MGMIFTLYCNSETEILRSRLAQLTEGDAWRSRECGCKDHALTTLAHGLAQAHLPTLKKEEYGWWGKESEVMDW